MSLLTTSTQLPWFCVQQLYNIQAFDTQLLEPPKTTSHFLPTLVSGRSRLHLQHTAIFIMLPTQYSYCRILTHLNNSTSINTIGWISDSFRSPPSQYHYLIGWTLSLLVSPLDGYGIEIRTWDGIERRDNGIGTLICSCSLISIYIPTSRRGESLRFSD